MNNSPANDRLHQQPIHPISEGALPDLDWDVGALSHLRFIENQSVLQGTATFLGVNHHVVLVQVCECGGMQVAVNDPDHYLSDVLRLNDGVLQTVRIPGLDGEFIMVVYPYAE
jgi:hypothetical protein